MRKKIIIYIIILIILAGLYLSFTSQAMKNISKKSSPQFQEKAQAEIQAANQSPSFRGPYRSTFGQRAQ